MKDKEIRRAVFAPTGAAGRSYGRQSSADGLREKRLASRNETSGCGPLACGQAEGRLKRAE